MATRTYIKSKKGHEEVWEWEETPEVLAALKVYWEQHLAGLVKELS